MGFSLERGERVPLGGRDIATVPRHRVLGRIPLVLAEPACCLRLGKAGFPNPGKPITRKQAT